MSRVQSQSDLVAHRQSRSLRPRQHTSFAACVVPDVPIIAAVVTQVILLNCVGVIKIPLLTCPREPGACTLLVKMGWDSECVEPGNIQFGQFTSIILDFDSAGKLYLESFESG